MFATSAISELRRASESSVFFTDDVEGDQHPWVHLAEIAKTVASGAHTALLVDQAGWRLSDALVVPPHITIVPLPAKRQELNPQENAWQFTRENRLSNRVFTSYENILDHCSHAWNTLIDRPWRIGPPACASRRVGSYR